MGAKKTGIRGEKQKKNRCNQNKNKKDWNIHVAIKEQQRKNTVDSNRKRRKRTGSQRKKLEATNIDP